MKKIYCELDNDDYAQISIDDGLVEISLAQGNDMNVVVFSPDKIRKLRKQLKKALEAIEGVEEESVERATTEYTSLKYSVGNTVRIIGNKYRTDNRYKFDEKSGHNFKIGELVNIVEIDINDEDRPYNCGGAYGWVTTEDIEPA